MGRELKYCPLPNMPSSLLDAPRNSLRKPTQQMLLSSASSVAWKRSAGRACGYLRQNNTVNPYE
jgi:hypothetical protein